MEATIHQRGEPFRVTARPGIQGETYCAVTIDEPVRGCSPQNSITIFADDAQAVIELGKRIMDQGRELAALEKINGHCETFADVSVTVT